MTVRAGQAGLCMPHAACTDLCPYAAPLSLPHLALATPTLPPHPMQWWCAPW